MTSLSSSASNLWSRIQVLGASLLQTPSRSAHDVIAPISTPLFLQAQTPRDISAARAVLRPISRDYLKIWLQLSGIAAFMAYLTRSMNPVVQTPWLIGVALFCIIFFWLGFHITRRRARLVETLLRSGEVSHGRVIDLMTFNRVPWFIVEFRDHGGRRHRARVTYRFDPGYYRPGAPAIVLIDEALPRRAAVIVRMKGPGECLQAFPAELL